MSWLSLARKKRQQQKHLKGVWAWWTSPRVRAGCQPGGCEERLSVWWWDRKPRVSPPAVWLSIHITVWSPWLTLCAPLTLVHSDKASGFAFTFQSSSSLTLKQFIWVLSILYQQHAWDWQGFLFVYLISQQRAWKISYGSSSCLCALICAQKHSVPQNSISLCSPLSLFDQPYQLHTSPYWDAWQELVLTWIIVTQIFFRGNTLKAETLILVFEQNKKSIFFVFYNITVELPDTSWMSY